jgi:TolA-binding protein
LFPDFVTIENRGMSILTALFIFFAGVGATICIQMMKQEFTRVDDRIDEEVERVDKLMKATNERVDSHQEKLESVKDDIAEMKTNIALTFQSVTRIERILEKERRNE